MLCRVSGVALDDPVNGFSRRRMPTSLRIFNGTASLVSNGIELFAYNNSVVPEPLDQQGRRVHHIQQSIGV